MVSKKIGRKVEKNGRRGRSISPKTIGILRWVALNLSTQRIMKRFGIGDKSVSKHKHNFVKRDWMTKDYELTALGRKIVDNDLSADGFRLENVKVQIDIPSYYRSSYKKRRYNFLSLKHWNWEQKDDAVGDFGFFHVDLAKVRVYQKYMWIQMPIIWEKTPSDCTDLMMDMLFDYIGKLENLYGIRLVFENKLNLKIISNEYAHIRSALARKFHHEKRTYFLKDSNGELRLKVDFSKGVPEMEAVHKDHGESDIKIVSKHTFDWIENDPPTNSELSAEMMRLMKLHECQISFGVETLKGFKFYGENMESHVIAVRELGAGITKLVRLIKDLNKSKNQR